MPQDVIAGIQQAATLAGLTGAERSPVDKCVSYLKANIDAIRYREFLAAGYPIATGVIEGIVIILEFLPKRARKNECSLHHAEANGARRLTLR